MMPDTAPEWHRMDPGAVCERLASAAGGLSASEAAARLAREGPNRLPEPDPVRPWAILWRQFHSVLVWILVAAACLSGLLGEWIDAAAILAIVLLNAVIGLRQEYGAEKSIAALRSLAAPRARVLRDGSPAVIPADEVVPGDILLLEAGDLVAADARLLRAASLRTVESALTGESEPVDKSSHALEGVGDVPLGNRANLVFMGTHVVAGEGRAVVVATGMATEIGRIARLIEQAAGREATPLQVRLATFGRLLVGVCLGLVGLLFAVGLLRGLSPLEMLLASVSLAVAAVPEGLPAVVTVALAVGVVRMARRRALVRRLPAVETLGSTNVICTDKTGTLTVGEMVVRELHVDGLDFEVTGEGYGPHGEVRFEGRAADAAHAGPLLELATVLTGCNNAELVVEEGRWQVVGDPTEGALLAAGCKAGAEPGEVESRLPRHHELPFDSDRKRRTVVRLRPDGGLRALVNGAPDLLLSRCTHLYTARGIRPMTDADREGILARNAEMASRALRVLGSARRDLPFAEGRMLAAGEVERDLVFVGLAGMQDPPRPEAREAVRRCREAGIRVVMITGDHPHTARAIARELGVAAGDDRVLTGADLDRCDEGALRVEAGRTGVFARVTAGHKLRLVRALQAGGAVVAMTGDGVNDAPAIRGADIGIAMGRTGTEVARQAADMIVTDDNFASIVAAVEEGRGIYDNIRKTLQYLLAGNAAELLLMLVAILVGYPVPLMPIHLLWVNLVTDGLPALCLATDPIDPDVMRRPPRPRRERLTAGAFLRRIVVAGGTTAAVAFGAFAWTLPRAGLELARTHAFTVLVFAEMLKSLAFRSEDRPLWRTRPLSNPRLLVLVAASLGVQLASHHHPGFARVLKASPVPLDQAAVLFLLALAPLAALEIDRRLRCGRG